MARGTVLVTGGTGFVAGWCIVELLRQGYAVRVTLRDRDRLAPLREAVAGQIDPGDRIEAVVADLTADAGWAEAVAGVRYVLHVASPLGSPHPADADALVVPAREGTLRVLRAATKAGVRRVVMTSSLAAATPTLRGPSSVNDETVWSDPDDPALTPYRRSKLVAERAAWDLMGDPHVTGTDFTTVLPGAVFGPVLSPATLGSVMVIGRMLQGMPGVPRVGFDVTDVRDLAVLHVLAMESAEAADHRFFATGDFLMMGEMAAALRQALGEQASRVPRRTLPDTLVRMAALRNDELKTITLALGRTHRHPSDKARQVLGWRHRPVEETVVDTGRRLLELGLV